MEVDFLVVGQGLAGTLVAHNLLQKGKKILVFDILEENSSSRVAAGLYNPVTGKRRTKTWLADDLFPFIEPYYQSLENLLHTKFLRKKTIFRPFESIADQNDWALQSTEKGLDLFLELAKDTTEYTRFFHAEKGGLKTRISGYLEVKTLLDAFAEYLKKKHLLNQTAFSYSKIEFSNDKICYEGIVANSVIFCEGHMARKNPFFNYLPLNGTKGEILDVEIKDYTLSDIVNKGVFVLPEEKKQRIGSTYEWNFEDNAPTTKAKEELCLKLEKILKHSYRIVDQKAGIRPTTKDRRPLIGRHPEIKNVFIFNGLGTKGVSLAPYFSVMFANWLLGEGELLKDVNITRFPKN